MSLVLAFEPDAAQAEPLTAVVRAKLGARLQMVASTHAAIVAINQGVPDVLLIGRDVPQDQRTRIVTHMRSFITDGGPVRTLDIPQFDGNGSTDAFAKKVGACLAAAEDAHVRAMASMLGRPAESDWDAIPLEEAPAPIAPAAPIAAVAPADAISEEDDMRAADVSLIEAEVEFRLQMELDRLQADAARQQAAEIARVEAEAAERRAQEIARIEQRAAAEASAREALAAELERVRREMEHQLAAEVQRVRNEAEQLLAGQLDVAQADAERVERLRAEAVRQQAAEIERVEAEAAERQAREIARIEQRAAAEASAREAELERVRNEAQQQLAAEVQRVRKEAEQLLATKLDLAQAQAERDREERIARARAEAEAARNAAIEEARQIVEEAAARAQMAEDEVERVRRAAEGQLKEAVARARQESEAELEQRVARARAEAELRLEAQLASVIGENEQVKHAHRQAEEQADRIRLEAAQAARKAAEEALATETARIRAEADEKLEAEIVRLRAEAAALQVQATPAPEMRLFESASATPEEPSVLAQVSRSALLGIRWDFVATAALCSLVVVAGIVYLPAAVRTAGHTSSTIVGSAASAAKAAAKKTAAVAPVVANRALTVAERALPRPKAAAAETLPEEPPAGTDPVEAVAAQTGPGFLKAFARIPMDIYADGTRIGSTEDGRNMLLPSGTHRIEFVSERFRYRSSILLKVQAGHVHPYTVALPTAAVRVTTEPGADVFVDGERVGTAPVGTLQVPLGTREISIRTAAGEKRRVLEVKYGEAADVSLMPESAAAEAAGAPHLAPLVRSY